MTEEFTKEDFTSAPFHFRDFKESSVWRDIKLLLNDMKEDIRGNLEVVKELEELYRFQGRADVIQIMLAVPDNILGILEDESEGKQDDLPDQPDEIDI